MTFHMVLGAVAVIAMCIRLLFYTLSFQRMGLFVLGLTSTVGVTGQFFLGFSSIIIGFSAALNSLYGGLSPNFSTLQEYYSATKIALAGMLTIQVMQSVFMQFHVLHENSRPDVTKLHP